MEVSRVRVKSELQLPAYTTATATPDLSPVWDLHHSSRQCRVPDPLSKARNQTCILMNTSQIRFCCITIGTLRKIFQGKNLIVELTNTRGVVTADWIWHKIRFHGNRTENKGKKHVIGKQWSQNKRPVFRPQKDHLILRNITEETTPRNNTVTF